MDKAELWIGLFFIVLGFLVYKFPMLISGYNTLPKKEREKIDIRPVASRMRTIFCIMGLILMTVPFLLDRIGLSAWNEYLGLVVTLGGVAILLILNSRKQDTKKISRSKANKIGGWIAAGITILVFGSIIQAAQPAKINIENGMVNISGAYRIKIPLAEITKAEVTENIPRVKRRNNGLSFARYHKGHFQMEDYGRSRLYLHSGKPPYLVLTTQKNGTVIINRSTPEEIYALYEAVAVP